MQKRIIIFISIFFLFFCSVSKSDAYNPDFIITDFDANSGFFKVDHESFPVWAVSIGYGCQNIYLKNVNSLPFHTPVNVTECYVASSDQFETSFFTPFSVNDGTYEIVLNDAHYTNSTNYNWLISQAFNISGGIKTTNMLNPTTKISLINLNTNTGIFTIDPSSFPANYQNIGSYQCRNVGLRNLDTRESFGLDIPSCTSAFTEVTSTTYFMPLSVPDGNYELVFPDSHPSTLITNNFFIINGIATIPSLDINLNVPLFKQSDNMWKNLVYDSANIWNPSDPKINSWGCGLTSAAMVFKYHGLNKLPDNTSLNPGTLNSWLKNQKDGYVGNGFVNWLALSRLSKKSKSINGVSFDALEYTRTNGNATEKLTSNLKNNLPGILSTPGHFVVAKGIENNIFTINDPYYERTSLSEYGNTFQNLGTFKPSNTDLSYIMITTDPNTNVQILNSNGESVGEEIIDGEITNPQNPQQSNGPIKIIYVEKPTEANYNISVSANGNYSLNVYLYDKNGEVFTKKESGFTAQEQNKIIPLIFNGQNTLYPKKTTYVLTTLDIEKFYKQKLITDKNLVRELEELLTRALIQKALGNDERELKLLLEFENQLNIHKDTKIKLTAYETLLYDVNYLSTH